MYNGKPKTYNCHFIGRKVGAIGITYPIETNIEADNPKEALSRCYDNYEHILDFKCCYANPEPIYLHAPNKA